MPQALATTPLRIIHLPDVVGGHPVALSAGERALGHASQTLSYLQSPYGYTADRLVPGLEGGMLRRWTGRARTFLSIRNRFDVFHFNFGRSLMSSASGRLILGELPFYPKRAVRVMTFQGSDARTVYGPELAASIEVERQAGRPVDAAVWSDDALAARREHRLAVIAKAARHCDALLALNPDLLAPLPRDQARFFPYAIDPSVAALAQDRASVVRQAGVPLHVVHLSTNRVYKGTALIERALAEISARPGRPLTFEVVERRSRDEALAAIARADIVIDQMVLGWYGAAAVEACYMGKPLVTYISDAQAAAAPAELVADLPFVRAGHANLADVLDGLRQSPEQLAALGPLSRAFARKWHDPLVVARQSLALYEDIRSGKAGSRP
ncbi:MAG: hypothetical protein WAT70_05175 [Rhizobiaceae bacterium]